MNIITERRKTKKARKIVITTILVFALALLAVVTSMNIRSTNAQRELLKNSIESQLLSITIAARNMVDSDVIDSYKSKEDMEADEATYISMRANLRDLARTTQADYIYILKYVGDEVMFVLDTDEEDESVFIPYDPDPVHLEAFAGENASGVMNVVDEYGSYNTAAIPIMKDGKVIAVISTDIRDHYYQESLDRGKTNQLILLIVLASILTFMIILIFFLLSQVWKMQNQLYTMAHYDTVTGLPNRKYLLDLLEDQAMTSKEKPYALVFIDLDNFKNINDTAGHDMGDEVLKEVGDFLNQNKSTVHSFRPSAGQLNIAARVGGDEFVQIVDDVSTVEDAEKFAQDTLSHFSSERFLKYRENYGLGLSIGIALYPMHTQDYHVLIKYADIAMYHAKHGGKNSYRIYEEDMAPKNEK
ncbi:diguanylate cyclase (GGDEF)-like protein [Aequitasia blattaphilus]|uniref:GGDEF domain-containing protein n=1 Tax=Aequitasia blattaphilus TaxID=2949332 RepID=A0ABT1EBE9_9FIRM|nr:GGDEF domain-containing protein [Aequitasia blattaphilus]MCP1103159.1 GGDEF domain-containing protein [Aequitasia blattaphilus]MCR8615799.1 GGDEF domain-containing protein [Aequitasia blattaphilus]